MPEVLVISATEQLALDGDAQVLIEQVVEQERLESVEAQLLVDQVTVHERLESVEAQLLVDQVVAQEMLDFAMQGPPGPQGPGGPHGGSTFPAELAEDVGGHRAVRATLAGLAYADAGNAAHAGRVVGITTGAGSAGALAEVQTTGLMVNHSWAWVPAEDIWLGPNSVLVQTIPLTAAFAQRLGYAVTPASIWVEISEPIIF